ncbi:MAG: hypothetical protein WCJ62_11640, partial [Flavobacterium sp.]
MSTNYNIIQGGTTFNLDVKGIITNNNSQIRLLCKSAGGAIVINLPPISDFEVSIEASIFVDDVDDMASTNNITINSSVGNTIENASFYRINTNGGKVEIYISNFIEFGVLGLGKTINIPTTIVKVGVTNSAYNMPNLFAYYLPTSDNSFLNYNPKYYLFMAKSKKNHIKKINDIPTNMNRLAGFYHPTHQNGINFPTGSKFYSGQTAIPLDSEFSLTPNPYTLTQIGFNPFQWTRVKDGVPTWQVPILSDVSNTILVDKFKVQGKNGNKNKRSALFSLAIGIENPDTTSSNPILFGDLSQ